MSAPITLRPLRLSDAPELLEVRQRNEAFLAPWEPLRTPDYFTLESQRREIAAGESDMRAGAGYPYAVIEVPTGAIVGRIALSGIVRGVFHNAYLGYFVDGACNGRGYATAAVGEVLSRAFGELRLHRVQAAVMPRNAGSLRVLERNGFRREGLAERYLKIAGRWEDHILHAITAEER